MGFPHVVCRRDDCGRAYAGSWCIIHSLNESTWHAKRVLLASAGITLDRHIQHIQHYTIKVCYTSATNRMLPLYAGFSHRSIPKMRSCSFPRGVDRR
jgi:hypothetical protein